MLHTLASSVLPSACCLLRAQPAPNNTPAFGPLRVLQHETCAWAPQLAHCINPACPAARSPIRPLARRIPWLQSVSLLAPLPLHLPSPQVPDTLYLPSSLDEHLARGSDPYRFIADLICSALAVVLSSQCTTFHDLRDRVRWQRDVEFTLAVPACGPLFSLLLSLAPTDSPAPSPSLCPAASLAFAFPPPTLLRFRSAPPCLRVAR
ncbi:hypothetical protein C8R45DRAFT_1115036 [Mycena sanguinolenta]|nr:hypothetical protein C8R45DRAFT_1115036 [Mycena sanguinolenta]